MTIGKNYIGFGNEQYVDFYRNKISQNFLGGTLLFLILALVPRRVSPVWALIMEQKLSKNFFEGPF